MILAGIKKKINAKSKKNNVSKYKNERKLAICAYFIVKCDKTLIFKDHVLYNKWNKFTFNRNFF